MLLVAFIFFSDMIDTFITGIRLRKKKEFVTFFLGMPSSYSCVFLSFSFLRVIIVNILLQLRLINSVTMTMICVCP